MCKGAIFERVLCFSTKTEHTDFISDVFSFLQAYSIGSNCICIGGFIDVALVIFILVFLFFSFFLVCCQFYGICVLLMSKTDRQILSKYHPVIQDSYTVYILTTITEKPP